MTTWQHLVSNLNTEETEYGRFEQIRLIFDSFKSAMAFKWHYGYLGVDEVTAKIWEEVGVACAKYITEGGSLVTVGVKLKEFEVWREEISKKAWLEWRNLLRMTNLPAIWDEPFSDKEYEFVQERWEKWAKQEGEKRTWIPQKTASEVVLAPVDKRLHLQTVIKFGKYKGWNLQGLISHDPNYVSWCVENLGWFEINDETRSVLDEHLQSDREMFRRGSVKKWR